MVISALTRARNLQSSILHPGCSELNNPGLAYPMGTEQSPAVITVHRKLHKAALKGNWKDAEELLGNNPRLVPITEGGETALHIAALEGHASFVTNLLEKMEDSVRKSNMEMLNVKGNTALCFAATSGHLNIVKHMVDQNRDLTNIRGPNGVTPLYMAALLGKVEIADHLYSAIPNFQSSWSKDDQVVLLTTSIESGLFGLATRILNNNELLATTEVSIVALQVLALKPSAFCRNSRRQLCGNIARIFTTQDIPESRDAYSLLDCLWKNAMPPGDIETGYFIEETAKLFFTAADLGNDEFLVELINRHPDLLYKVNEKKQTIFHIAILHRYVPVFNLLYELRGLKDLIASYIDDDENNMLHLAAKLLPQIQLNDIPGAALKMQREVLWYKEVEKIVPPSYRDMKNLEEKTPSALFLSEHENLMKEGEKLMKQMAKSCMLVAMLIATIVFTTAFTVPGGYDNNTGLPIMRNHKLFKIFPISEAVATLSSSISMLMFLSILSSRYSKNDFLKSLPLSMVVGVTMLFISIVAMMLTFCTCLLLYQSQTTVIYVLVALFAIVPTMFFILKFSLLVAIWRSMCDSKWLFRSNNRLSS